MSVPELEAKGGLRKYYRGKNYIPQELRGEKTWVIRRIFARGEIKRHDEETDGEGAKLAHYASV